jgi:hypothetical protein
LSKLSTQDKYKGHDRVHTADGSGMEICHIGHSILRTPNSSLHLSNILHVPDASKNLLFVNKLTLDNDVFFEFRRNFFFIKDLKTRRILFKRPCRGGLYPIVPIPIGESKQDFLTVKPSSSMWHHRLGHPSSFIVNKILKKHNISYS